jgi:hypothetical protein
VAWCALDVSSLSGDPVSKSSIAACFSIYFAEAKSNNLSRKLTGIGDDTFLSRSQARSHNASNDKYDMVAISLAFIPILNVGVKDITITGQAHNHERYSSISSIPLGCLLCDATD